MAVACDKFCDLAKLLGPALTIEAEILTAQVAGSSVQPLNPTYNSDEPGEALLA